MSLQLETIQNIHIPILQSLALCLVVFLQWIIISTRPPPLSCLVKLENSTSDNSDSLLPLLSLLI